MKILYYDCFSGISGDMNLGAMIDLGVDVNYLLTELGKLNLEGWKLDITSSQRHGIKGTKVTVLQTIQKKTHRGLTDIFTIIDRSSLEVKTRELSKKIFRKLAEAESAVHGTSVEDVHFHEVGAIDAIIDIVGAAICFNILNVDEVHVSVIETGGGTVRCEHGILPVPAPATVEILKNLPVRKGGVDFEATTPTGAAIIAVLGNVFNQPVPVKIIKTGHGIGQKDHPETPNLLRVFLCEAVEAQEEGHEAILLECNIDDMNPEHYEYISEKLFGAGASDVYLTSTIMKRSRPGTILSVICEKEIAGLMKEIIFTESTTLGIRCFSFKKETLSRNFEKIETQFGPVTFKKSYYKGRLVSFKPEHSDCRRIAGETGRPLREIYNILLNQVQNTKDG
ncbi:MAG: nickel pincer cofactor biosynthesis protein LarC [Bacteroidales bacterium]